MNTYILRLNRTEYGKDAACNLKGDQPTKTTKKKKPYATKTGKSCLLGLHPEGFVQ